MGGFGRSTNNMKIIRYLFIALLSIGLAMIINDFAKSFREVVDLGSLNESFIQEGVRKYRATLIPWIAFLILSLLAWGLLKSKAVSAVFCLFSVLALAWSYATFFQIAPGYRIDQKWSFFVSSLDLQSIAVHGVYILSPILTTVFIARKNQAESVEQVSAPNPLPAE